MSARQSSPTHCGTHLVALQPGDNSPREIVSKGRELLLSQYPFPGPCRSQCPIHSRRVSFEHEFVTKASS